MTRRTSEEAPQANLPTPPATARVGAEVLLDALAEYRVARRRLLNVLGLPMSNRDPVPEVAEHLVADILGGTLAPSRVQAAWDVETPAGKVQVRTLSNTGADAWINEHVVRSAPSVDRYAPVILEDLAVSAVLVVPADLTRVGAHLGEHHGVSTTAEQVSTITALFSRVVDTGTRRARCS